jgi:hypothetical protein
MKKSHVNISKIENFDKLINKLVNDEKHEWTDLTEKEKLDSVFSYCYTDFSYNYPKTKPDLNLVDLCFNLDDIYSVFINKNGLCKLETLFTDALFEQYWNSIDNALDNRHRIIKGKYEEDDNEEEDYKFYKPL